MAEIVLDINKSTMKNYQAVQHSLKYQVYIYLIEIIGIVNNGKLKKVKMKNIIENN